MENWNSSFLKIFLLFIELFILNKILQKKSESTHCKQQESPIYKPSKVMESRAPRKQRISRPMTSGIACYKIFMATFTYLVASICCCPDNLRFIWLRATLSLLFCWNFFGSSNTSCSTSNLITPNIFCVRCHCALWLKY